MPKGLCVNANGEGGGGGDRLLVKKVAKKLPTFGLGTNWPSQCPFYLD